MSSSSQRAGVVPACLSFLAIYNPSLGKSEDSLDEQIVYYYSKPVGQRTEAVANGSAREEPDGQEQNKRLRQIGLAQGMVEFAKYISRSSFGKRETDSDVQELFKWRGSRLDRNGEIKDYTTRA